MDEKLLDELEAIEAKATPGPLTASANYPFYAVIDKPSPSLSKHDDSRPSYWRIEDVECVLAARNHLKDLIRLARLGLWAEQRAFSTLNVVSDSTYWPKYRIHEWMQEEANRALAALPKEP